MKLEKDKCRNAVLKWLLDYHIYIYMYIYVYICKRSFSELSSVCLQ